MKITIRALCGRDTDAALGLPPNTLVAPDFDATSPEFDRLLKVSKTRSPCFFNSWMEFTPGELAQSRFFQLDCRGRLLKESDKDYDLNRARLESLPFIAAGPGAKMRFLDRLVLRAPSVKPNEVACAGEWMREFVVSGEVGRIFESEGLAGFSLREVFDSRIKRESDSCFQLYTDQIMPRALVDLTTLFRPDLDSHRQLGSLRYDFKGSPPASDFYRTAEAWGGNTQPAWIVSSRVRECYQRRKLRGWAFRPVLEPGSELHAGHMRMWEDLFARIAASHPDHHF